MLGHRRGALVGMLLGGCVPKDDLDSYAGTAGVSGEPSGGSSGTMLDAGAGAGGAAGTGNPAEPDAAAGGSAGAGGAPDMTPDAGDGGAPFSDAGPLPDAGGDAGVVLAAQCAATGGTLEPGTRDCFFVSAAVLSWQNAVNACIARQSTLAAIKTSERDQFLTTLLTASAWIGARDAAMLNPATNNFTWLDGTSLVAFSNWATAEPDTVADQFCVAKTIDTAAGPWRDRACSEPNAYICERSL